VAGLIAQGITPQSGYDNGMTENCSHQYNVPTDDRAADLETSQGPVPGYDFALPYRRPDA